MIEKMAKTTKFLLIVILFWSTILFVSAIFSDPTIGEAYTGSFRAKDFSDGWTLSVYTGKRLCRKNTCASAF